MKFSYYSPHLEILWGLLKTNHVAPAAVFSKYGLKHEDIKDPAHRTPLKLIPRLWDDASKAINNPCFGLNASQFWHPAYLGALGYGWLNSSSLREAFMRLSRYINILAISGHILLEEKGQYFHVILQPEELGINNARADNALSVLMHMCRINFQEELNPYTVTFSHDKPTCSDDYPAYFKCHVSFKLSHDSLVFPLGIIDKKLPYDNKKLADINDNIIIQYLKSLNHKSLDQQIKQIIARKLPSGTVTGEIVAKELSMSHRTLQRKLKESGTSFKQLLEDSRRYLAEKYIVEGHFSVTEITFMLGFGELSSFSRAYKRWTGHSPKMHKSSLLSSL